MSSHTVISGHAIISLPYAMITLEATRHNGEIKRRTETPTVWLVLI